jgi:hypothetical protein
VAGEKRVTRSLARYCCGDGFEENEVDTACNVHVENEKCAQNLGLKALRDHPEHPRKQGLKAWVEFIWLRVRTGGELL